MKSHHIRFAVLLALVLLPSLAFADAAPAALDLGKSPVLFQMAGKTMGIARSLIFPLFLLGLFLEFLRAGGSDGRSYAKYLERFFLFTILLANVGGQSVYGRLMGEVLADTRQLADQISPPGGWYAYSEASRAHLQELWSKRSGEDAAGAAAVDQAKAAQGAQVAPVDSTYSARFGAWAHNQLDSGVGLAGGALIHALESTIVMVALVIAYVMSLLGSVFAALFYILGPLALAAGIPSASGTAGRWFVAFATYCTWPIFSSVLLQLVMALGTSTTQSGTTLSAGSGAVLSSFVTVACAFSVPALANSIVGGTARQVADFMAAVAPITSAAGALQSRVKAYQQGKLAEERKAREKEKDGEGGQKGSGGPSKGRGGQSSAKGGAGGVISNPVQSSAAGSGSSSGQAESQAIPTGAAGGAVAAAVVVASSDTEKTQETEPQGGAGAIPSGAAAPVSGGAVGVVAAASATASTGSAAQPAAKPRLRKVEVNSARLQREREDLEAREKAWKERAAARGGLDPADPQPLLWMFQGGDTRPHRWFAKDMPWHVSRLGDREADWHQRYRERGNKTAPNDPFPKQTILTSLPPSEGERDLEPNRSRPKGAARHRPKHAERDTAPGQPPVAATGSPAAPLAPAANRKGPPPPPLSALNPLPKPPKS